MVMMARGSIGESRIVTQQGGMICGAIHGRAGVIHIHHREVHTWHGIRCLVNGRLPVWAEGRID